LRANCNYESVVWDGNVARCGGGHCAGCRGGNGSVCDLK
jgi:hypothetical protein